MSRRVRSKSVKRRKNTMRRKSVKRRKNTMRRRNTLRRKYKRGGGFLKMRKALSTRGVRNAYNKGKRSINRVFNRNKKKSNMSEILESQRRKDLDSTSGVDMYLRNPTQTAQMVRQNMDNNNDTSDGDNDVVYENPASRFTPQDQYNAVRDEEEDGLEGGG